MVKVAIRFNHFPHTTFTIDEELELRGLANSLYLFSPVAWFNALVNLFNAFPFVTQYDELDPYFYDYVSRYIPLIRYTTVAGRNYFIVRPTDDVVSSIYAFSLSPHDDEPFYHAITIEFSQPVNKYLAIRLAKLAIEKLDEIFLEDDDVYEGLAEVIIDTDTGSISIHRIYADGASPYP